MREIEDFNNKFLAFAKTKSGAYRVTDIETCALAQFARSEGAGYTGAHNYSDSINDEGHMYPVESHKAAIGTYPVTMVVAFEVEEGDTTFYTWERLVTRLEGLLNAH